MKLGHESENHRKRQSQMTEDVSDFHKTNNLYKTVRYISNKYGYTIAAAARFLKEMG